MSEPMITQISVERAKDFRRIHANLAKYRITQGELMIMFSSIHTPPSMESYSLIVEEGEVIITWIQAKVLLDTLSSALKAIEANFGEIPRVQKMMSDEDFDRQNDSYVKNLGLIVS